MSERNNTGWWLQEPPDFDSEPPTYTDSREYIVRETSEETWLYDWDEDSENGRRNRELAFNETHDVLDSTQPANLFENIRIKDDGSFKVPMQFIQTPNNGIWCFESYGRVGHFKERDEYGEIRFFRDGEGEIQQPIWVPHLYPFEETDKKGLPVIRDRERCKLKIELTKIVGKRKYPTWVELTMNGRKYGSDPDTQYIQDGFYFNEFVALDTALIAEDVEYSERKWKNLPHYLSSVGRLEDYNDIMLGNLDIPQEYVTHSRLSEPLDWQSRQATTRVSGAAFGSIWVAVDDLRRGVDASVLFPCFNEE